MGDVVKVGFVSLGCPKNTVDTEEMMGDLAASGRYSIVNEAGDADVLVVNTCGFIEAAKRESIETILEMARHKGNGGRCRALVVTGCLAQRYGAELAQEIPEIDAVLGVDSWSSLQGAIDGALRGEKVGAYAIATAPSYDLSRRPKRLVSTARHSAYLRIAEGCDYRCRFCVIPQIRGPFRSRPPAELLNEAAGLVESGARELVLVAQDTAFYGRDLPDGGRPDDSASRGGGRTHKPGLAGLLRDLSKLDSLDWLRVLYIYPTRLNGRVLEELAKAPKFVPYFDLPIQHGSDRVLKAMGRLGGRKELLSTIGLIRGTFPDACLRASLMVGFPGEGDREFHELLSFMEEAHFDRAGVFRYSREEGTPAAGMAGQVPEEIKEDRYRQAMALQARLSEAANRTWVGRKLDVLVEDELETGTVRRLAGRSFREAPEIDGKVFLFDTVTGQRRPVISGQIVRATVLAAGPYDTFAEVEP